MKQLRLYILALLFDLAIFFNIERLDFGEQNLIDIQSFTYIFVLVGIMTILGVPNLWHKSVFREAFLIPWLGLYFLFRVLVFNKDPLIGGIHTYVLVTEIALLSASFWLAYKLASQIYDFEEAVANITFSESNRRVQPLENVLEDIQVELTRSRRYQSPLSVLVVSPQQDSININLHRTIQEVQRSMMKRYVLTGMARVISDVLRRTDLVIEQQEEGRFIILSPETPAEDSEVVVERIRSALRQELGISIDCGSASFPSDALTFEELLHQAEDDLKEPIRTVVMAAAV